MNTEITFSLLGLNKSSLSTTTEVPINSASQHPVWASALIGVALSLIIIVSIGGNILVCVAILTERKLKKVSNLFLISLAISDLVVSSLVMPFAVANDVLGYWPFLSSFCHIWISFDILSATASILNLCAISLDRYIHMKNPFRYEEWMNNRKCLAFIGIIWLLALLISFLPISLGWHEEKPTRASTTLNTTTTTTANPSNEMPTCSLNLNSTYAVVSSSVSFFIPCIVMVTIYSLIYKLARHHARSIQQTQAFDPSVRRSRISENKALFTLGMIMGLFLISWIPFFTVNLVHSICKCVDYKIFVAFTWLGYCNSTMNPIIYSKFNADFREAFRKILCCVRCRTQDIYAIKSPRGKPPRKTRKSPVNGHTQNGNTPVLPIDEPIEMKEMTVIDKDEKDDINENSILICEK